MHNDIYTIYRNVVKFWNRLCLINLKFKIALKGKVTWITSLKYILKSINKSLIISKIYDISTINKKLKDTFLDEYFEN